MPVESEFQRKLVARIIHMFPGCEVIKQDASKTQGVPDLLILWRNKWAMLEVKRSAKAAVRPNQQYYVDFFNGMSFAAFIYPENEEEVLSALQHAFGS
jgi:Holliday junction resolvase